METMLEVLNLPSMEKPKARLARSLESGRLPPTWLLHGPEGTGKWALAMELAAALLCDRPAPWRCDQCAACRKSATMNHPDLFVVFAYPTGGGSGKARDRFQSEFVANFLEFKREAPLLPYPELRNRFIPAERVTELLAWAQMSPREGPRKVAIIYEPELIVRSITDKLLKLTEEPPEDTTLILVSHRPESLASTIRSRARQVPIPRLGPRALAELLTTRGLAAPDADRVARSARGAVGMALSGLSGDDGEPLESEALKILAGLLEARSGTFMQVQMMQWKAERQKVVDMLDIWAVLIRDLSCSPYGESLLSGSSKSVSGTLKQLADPERAARALELIRTTQAAIGTNVHMGTALVSLTERLGALGRGETPQPAFWPESTAF